jgi:hypothetical protein
VTIAGAGHAPWSDSIWQQFSVDSGIPDKLLPAVRVAVFWIALPFIFLLIGVERYFSGTIYEVAGCIVCAFFSILIAVYWDQIFRRHKLTAMLWGIAAVGLLLFGGAIGALAVRSNFFGGEGTAGITTTTQATASVPPTPSDATVAQSAALRLLMRPNQDPQELTKDNIWRWYAFKIANVNPRTHETFPIGTYIFLTFDRPVQGNYRRVFSPSNPDLRFDVLDLTARSMIIGISNVDTTGITIEIQVSGAPL